MLLLVLVIFNYGFYLSEFCNCFFLVCATFLFPQQIMIMGYSLLFRFGVISLFQQSLVELLYHLLMYLLYSDSISISLSSLIFPAHLYTFTTIQSILFLLITSFLNLYLLDYCIKFSACSLQFFYSQIDLILFACFCLLEVHPYKIP